MVRSLKPLCSWEFILLAYMITFIGGWLMGRYLVRTPNSSPTHVEADVQNSLQKLGGALQGFDVIKPLSPILRFMGVSAESAWRRLLHTHTNPSSAAIVIVGARDTIQILEAATLGFTVIVYEPQVSRYNSLKRLIPNHPKIKLAYKLRTQCKNGLAGVGTTKKGFGSLGVQMPSPPIGPTGPTSGKRRGPKARTPKSRFSPFSLGETSGSPCLAVLCKEEQININENPLRNIRQNSLETYAIKYIFLVKIDGMFHFPFPAESTLDTHSISEVYFHEVYSGLKAFIMDRRVLFINLDGFVSSSMLLSSEFDPVSLFFKLSPFLWDYSKQSFNLSEALANSDESLNEVASLAFLVNLKRFSYLLYDLHMRHRILHFPYGLGGKTSLDQTQSKEKLLPLKSIGGNHDGKEFYMHGPSPGFTTNSEYTFQELFQWLQNIQKQSVSYTRKGMVWLDILAMASNTSLSLFL